MQPRCSGVSPWILLLFIALLRDTRAQSAKPGIVTNLKATVTTSSILVTWTKPEGHNSAYRVNWMSGEATTNETSKNITNLTAGVPYNITVTATANGTEGEGVTLLRYTEPEAVSNLTVTEVTTSSVCLNWTRPEGNSSYYRVQWTAETKNMTVTVTETNMTVTGLSPGVKYIFTVQSVAGDNETESEIRKISQYTKPEAVSNLTVAEVTTSSVSLNWTRPDGNSSFFRVQWTAETKNMTVTVTETNMTVTGLSPGVRYVFTVQSVAGDNETESRKTGLSRYTKPEAVSHLTVTEVTTSSVSLNWTRPEGNSSYYRVQWTDETKNMTVTVTETNMTVTGLTPGVRYVFTVQSVAGDNETESEIRKISQYTKPEAVSSLTVAEVTTSSVSLNWTRPEGNSSFYRVQWTAETKNMTVTVTETNMIVTGLTPGVKYKFTVQSVAGDNETESRKTGLARYTKPEAVSNLTVTEVTTSSVSLNWTRPEGNSSYYRVQWTAETKNMIVTVTETNMTVTGLTPGVKYIFTVQSVAGDNETESRKTGLSRYTKPEAVIKLTVTEVTTSSVSLNWTRPDGNSSYYRVQWTDETKNMTVTVTETNMTVTGLTPGVRYVFTVQSVAGDNETESEIRKISQYTKPEAVSSLTVAEVTTSSVSLNWTRPEGNSSFYRVQWTAETKNMTVTVTETNMIVTGLTPGVKYKFTVQSVAGDNETESRKTGLARYTKPEAVSNLTVTEVTTSSVSLNWTRPEGNSSYYRVQWTAETKNMIVTVTETNMTVTGLTPGVKYIFTVQSVAGDNETESRKTGLSRYTKPEAVIKLTVTEVTTSSVSLNWTRPDGNRSYYRVQWTDGFKTTNDNVTENNITVTGLTPGVRYMFTIQSVAGDNETESEMTEMYQYTKPGQIENLSVLSSNTSSISLSWTKPPGQAFLYKVETQNGDTAVTIFVNDTSAVLANLIPGTEYTMTVTAVAGDNKTEGLPRSLISFTYPEAVRNISITHVSTSSVYLEWRRPEGNVSVFIVHWANESFSENINVTVTHINISGLTPGVQHNFSVTTVAGEKVTPGETEMQYTRPEKPTDIVVTHRGTVNLTISWTLPDGRADHYLVNVSNSVYQNVIQMDVPPANVGKLYPGRIYDVSVTSVAGNLRHKTDEVSFATFPTPPGPVSISERSNSSLKLEWSTPEMMEGAPDIYYRIIYYTEGGEEQLQNATALNTVLHLLSSGSLYHITIETVGPQNFNSTAVHTSFFTLPNPVLNLTARPNSTTAVAVEWLEPQGVQSYYTYLVEVFSDTGHSVPSQNVSDTSIVITDLVPGSGYSISVTTMVAPGSQSTAEQTSSYTQPESVSDLTVIGDTTNLTVSWQPPSGHVFLFSALLYNDGQLVDKKTNLSNATFNTEFVGLRPGVEYCVVLVTQSGPYENNLRVCNATFPNPPGPITVQSQTFESINFTWTFPEDMTPDQCNFSVSTAKGSFMTENNWYLLDKVQSGSSYNISVVTVGVRKYESTEVTAENYTRPRSVTNLRSTQITTDSVTLVWEQPESKAHFSYLVQVTNSSGNSSLIVQSTNATITGLESGSNFSFTVTTLTADSTQADAVTVSYFTRPHAVTNLRSTQITTDSVTLVWEQPESKAHFSYLVQVTNSSGSSPLTVQSTNATITGLESGSNFSFTVTTLTADGTQADAVTVSNFTRPRSVTNLRSTQITTDSVTLVWEQPESKAHFSYLVQVTNSSGNSQLTVQSTNTTITGLESGSNFSFTVTTLTADGTQADAVTVSYFTRPHGVTQLKAETLNTTDIRLDWEKPLEYKPYYRYWLEVSGCATRSSHLSSVTVVVSELNPGTNCTFCVSVEAEVIRGTESCISQYTKPERVHPSVDSLGSSSSIWVWWTKPGGNVEKYQVFLNSSSSGSNGPMQQKYSELDSNTTDLLFEGLSAGSLYSAMIITISGPFKTESALSENATYPNPPGPIEILTKTTGSLKLTWGEPPLMAGAQFSYKLTNAPVLSGGSLTTVATSATTHTFDNLPSGTSFRISVLTVGVLDFESREAFLHSVTTRPLSVKSLTATPDETMVTVNWVKPADYKNGYHYNLTWQRSDEALSHTETLSDTEQTISELSPGSSYNFSVTTVTSDGTTAEPVWTSSCTNASRVNKMTCRGPNQPNAEIILSWEKPDGQNTGFSITENNGKFIDYESPCCNFTVPNLQHYYNYSISVQTQSCGRPSRPETKVCQSGITNPPISSDYKTQIKSSETTHRKFSIEIASSLINNTNGPVTHVGVLVRESGSGGTSDCSDCNQYLGKTYQDWKDKATQVYLATVIKTDVLQFRSSRKLSVDVGDGAEWNGYTNGPLDADTEYRFAIVLFTGLTINNGLVNGLSSLVSITDFDFVVKLLVDPAVIGIAVGATLGVFLILLIILIGFIIYWKRVSSKESPDIQIHSLRAKVSVPVRVEDYEAYFRKQKADSNCGFAEEYEELKSVGIGQSKIHALSLENKPKNRYSNVLPYDSSRVKLSIIHGNPNDDYINANYVPGYNSRKEFIAAQGPLPATVNAFWRMIWEKNVQTLVMLTRCNEQGRVKCEQYWSLGTKHYENITVTTTSEIPLEDWTIREFAIKNVKTAETRTVRHFHFTAWPDHGVPETTELLITFRHLVREHMNQYSKHSPTVVHCSAGVGRTGTLISIDRLMFQIERENIVDVYGIVHDLRMHRSLMVQTEDQYVFLNQCALDVIRSRTGTNVDLIYQNAAALAIYENVEPKRGFSKNRY